MPILEEPVFMAFVKYVPVLLGIPFIFVFPEGGDDVCGCRINLYFRLLFTSIFTLAGRHGSLQPYITETSITRTIQMRGVEKVLQPASAIFHRSN